MHPYDSLIELIKKNKWDKLNIGVEMDSHYFTAYCYEKLKQGLPNAKIKDSDRLVNWARLEKSEAEINLMKGAALISQQAMKVAMESINPGVRQCDAVAVKCEADVPFPVGNNVAILAYSPPVSGVPLKSAL
jgi:Xaa-Pro dipeptidase/ectoine hydrolase